MNGYREKLLELDKEILVDTLLRVSTYSETAMEVIMRLANTPSENSELVKRKIARLKDQDVFYDRRSSRAFAQELENMVEAIEVSAEDPNEGIERLADFFACDRSVIESCDDSDGLVGDVFRSYATEVFAAFGQKCADKAWLSDVVLRLWAGDDYGVRERLLEKAEAMFPKETMRNMAKQLWARADHVSDAEEHPAYRRRKFFNGVMMLARQLQDAPLYEKAMRAAWTDLPLAFCLDIGRVYLEAGDAVSALEWANKDAGDDSRISERDELLYDIFKQQKDRKALEEVAWRIFRRTRNARNLDKLLHAIGKKHRAVVLEQECTAILETDALSYSDASFLLEVNRLEDAARYILKHAADLDGGHYYYLLPLAEAMERARYWLPAVLCYRALIDSILQRAVSKYYHHGVKYLRQLDNIACKVEDWNNFPNHSEYSSALAAAHKRKRSFWDRYGGFPKS